MEQILQSTLFICALLSVQSLSNKISISARNTYDNSVVICDRCDAHLYHNYTTSTWAPVYAVKKDNSLALQLTYEDFDSDNQDDQMQSVVIRNPLFLQQSPCLVSSQDRNQTKSLQQVVCSSSQNFLCQKNEKKGMKNAAKASKNNETCQVTGVCWSEDEVNPVPGCLPKPIPGTTKVSSMYSGSRIINGYNAVMEKHPWAVYVSIQSVGHCGGSVIGKHLVLTAKHCAVYPSHPYALLMGDVDRTHVGQPMKMTDYTLILHPYQWADVAVIKLKDEIQFSTTISPIAIPADTSDAPDPGELVGVYGWGLACDDPPTCTSENKDPELLQAAKIKVFENATYCPGELYSDEDVPPPKKALLFCAGGYMVNKRALENNVASAPEIPKDACSGDSGGAVECYRQDGTIYACGVVSIGPDPPFCGKAPGAYMETYNAVILNWLRNVVSNDSVWEGGIRDELPADNYPGADDGNPMDETSVYDYREDSNSTGDLRMRMIPAILISVLIVNLY